MKKLMVVLTALVMLFASCNKESSEKKILSFKFASPAVEAVVEESAKTVVAVVPMGTDVTSLVPLITISEKATINPGSGLPQNFTNPVQYVVTAEDGSQQAYIVTVTVDQNGGGGGGGGNTDPTNWSGDIDANTTWHDLGLSVDYIVDGYVHINNNALLTIEPGVTIMFTGVDGGIDIGENAGLCVSGTEENPVVFTGPTNNPNPGSWDKITIRSNRADNKLEHVHFLNGGSGDGDWDGVLEVHGKASVKNCLIDGSLSNGFVTEYDGVTNGFENNIIRNCAAYPWLTENNEALLNGKVSGHNDFVNNGRNYVGFTQNWYEVDKNVTLVKMAVPYCCVNGLDLRDTHTFTIEPGTEIVFENEQRLFVEEGVTFVAQGTAEQPIVFRGIEEGAGRWNGIVYCSHKSASTMDYCVVDGAGINGWGVGSFALGIWEGSQLNLNNCIFSNSAEYGIAIDEISDMPNIKHSNNQYINCALGNVIIETGGEYNGVEYADESVLDQLP